MNTENNNSQGLNEKEINDCVKLNEEEINDCVKDCFRILITLFLILSLIIGGIIGLAYCSKFIGNLLSAIITAFLLITIFVKMDWLIRVIVKGTYWILPKASKEK